MRLFKEDWEQSKKRFEAFWQNEIFDRCCVSVTAPLKQPRDLGYMLEAPKNVAEQWTNTEQRFNSEMFLFSYAHFGGESYPMIYNNMGPGLLAAALGSDYTFKEETVWYGGKPVLHNLVERPTMTINPENSLWKTTLDMTEYMCRHSEGRFHVGVTDIGGSLDIASSLRGAQDLIFDLVDHPDAVAKFIEEIDSAWIEGFNAFQGIIEQGMQGCSNWMKIWNPSRWYPLQCDFSVFMSPKQFREFVIPSLERQLSVLDTAIYHLDGPDAIKHLDYVLELDKIAGIQWAPTNYSDPMEGVSAKKWYPMYQKIQSKGKRLVLMNVKPMDIERLLSDLSSKGLFIITHCDSSEEADELLKKVQRWTRD